MRPMQGLWPGLDFFILLKVSQTLTGKLLIHWQMNMLMKQQLQT
jgi:hypothetical protein